jgi:hypothetical protein
VRLSSDSLRLLPEPPFFARTPPQLSSSGDQVMNAETPSFFTSLTSLISFTSITSRPLSPLSSYSSPTPSSNPFVLIFFQKTGEGGGIAHSTIFPHLLASLPPYFAFLPLNSARNPIPFISLRTLSVTHGWGTQPTGPSLSLRARQTEPFLRASLPVASHPSPPHKNQELKRLAIDCELSTVHLR